MTNSALRIILSNIRGAGNVGSILRTADACDVELIYACGYTPYPRQLDDLRPAHVGDANQRAIAKTALGAETTVPVLHRPDTATAIHEAKRDGFKIIVIEQAESALNLYHYQLPPSQPLALVLGNEVDGVAAECLALADTILELPMLGRKESLNVAVAAAIALYQLRFGTG
jgi:tRNA G18 (ribose-2'-O)-methylase SpoU